MSKCLEVCRLTYNKILETKIELYKTEQKSLSKYDVDKLMTKQKDIDENLNLVHSQILQNVSKRVALAYDNFFRRVKQGTEKPGFPRFKAYGRYDSFTFPQNNGSFRIIDNQLKLSKIGKVRINLHRPLEGDIRTLTVRKTQTGKWYACFSSLVENEVLEENDLSVGIDLGLKTFAMFSDECQIKNPRFFKDSETRLKRFQSRFSKEEKGIPQRKKLGKILQKVHERVTFRRDDFCHKESRKIVQKYHTICIEDLNIKSMMKVDKDNQDKKLHKSIGEVAWKKFTDYLTYKAEEAGRNIVKVNPRNTSKMCSGCGVLVPKELKDRVHECPNCGLVMDRDLNASLNILRLGLESLCESATPTTALEAPLL